MTVINTLQIGRDARSGRVDLLITHEHHVTIIEWKVIRMKYLQIGGGIDLDKASTLSNELLKVKFGANDFRGESTTIEQWVRGRDAKSPESQVTRYFESPEITEFRKDSSTVSWSSSPHCR